MKVSTKRIASPGSTEKPDGDSLLGRIWRGPGVSNCPGLLDSLLPSPTHTAAMALGIDTHSPSDGSPSHGSPLLQDNRSLTSQVIRGSAWTLSGYALAQVLRLGSNIVLSRLLFPEAFGVMIIVNMVMQGLQMFSDVGINQSIIQHKRGDDPIFMNTAWTIQVMRGIALCLVACLLAWPLSRWYGESSLSAIIPVVAISVAISGFTSTKLMTLNRHMAFGRLTFLDLGTQVLSIAIMCIWAQFNPSPWALVAGGLSSSTLRMLLSQFLLPGPRNRFAWSAGTRAELMHFGRWIFFASALNFLASSGDRVLLAKYFSVSKLGIYGVAFMLADAAAQVTSTLSHRVLFPAFGRVARTPGSDLSSAYYRVRGRWDLLVMPAIGLLISGGSVIVHILYDSRYQEAGWMLQILAWRSVWLCLMVPGSVCLLALGKPQYATLELFIRCAWVLLGIPLASNAAGDQGIVTVVGFAGLLSMPAIWWGLHRERVLNPRREVLAPMYLCIGIGAGLLFRRMSGIQ